MNTTPPPKRGGQDREREKKFGEPGCPRGRRYADRFTLRLEKPVCLIHFGLTIAAMDAAAEIVFSPPAQPCVRTIATVAVAVRLFERSSDRKPYEILFLLCFVLFSREGLVVSS